MYEIGQWFILGAAILVLLVMLWFLARLMFRVVVIVFVAVLLVGVLHYFSLLPEPVHSYVQELLSEKNVDKVKAWMDWSKEAPSEQPEQSENP